MQLPLALVRRLQDSVNKSVYTLRSYADGQFDGRPHLKEEDGEVCACVCACARARVCVCVCVCVCVW